MHVVRWSIDSMMMSVTPYHLCIWMICSVLKEDIVVPNNIGLRTPSPFLSVNMVPTFRYIHIGGVYIGNSFKFLMS